jgi:hypothetical protein
MQGKCGQERTSEHQCEQDRIKIHFGLHCYFPRDGKEDRHRRVVRHSSIEKRDNKVRARDQAHLIALSSVDDPLPQERNESVTDENLDA